MVSSSSRRSLSCAADKPTLLLDFFIEIFSVVPVGNGWLDRRVEGETVDRRPVNIRKPSVLFYVRGILETDPFEGVLSETLISKPSG